MKPIRTTLKIYWDDDVTVEERYFKSIRQAMRYVKDNGITNYQLESEENDYYFKIEFTYGDVIYTRGSGTSPNDAVKGLCNDFTHIWKIKQISKSTWDKHKND